MRNTEVVEFGSPEWIAAAGKYLDENISALDRDAPGVSFSMCEVWLSVPAHLADAAGRAGWWFEIDGAAVKYGSGVRDDVAVHIEVDYQETLAFAHMIFDLQDPKVVALLSAQAARRHEMMGDAGAAVFESLPDAVRTFLLGLHNYLVPRTA